MAEVEGVAAFVFVRGLEFLHCRIILPVIITIGLWRGLPSITSLTHSIWQSIWYLGRQNSVSTGSPKISKVKKNARAPALKKVARVFPIGRVPS